VIRQQKDPVLAVGVNHLEVDGETASEKLSNKIRKSEFI
jgi:hypothetical protein